MALHPEKLIVIFIIKEIYSLFFNMITFFFTIIKRPIRVNKVFV